MSRTIMIASGKGGTGKSMAAVNIAASLAYAGSKTVLVDMSHGLRSLDFYLGLESRTIWDICDVINGICDMENVLLRVDAINNLYLMPATQKRRYPEITAESLAKVIDELKEEFDYIFLDCPAGAGELVEMALECTDEALLVVTPDYISLRDADVIEDMVLRSGIFKRFYVVNSISTELNAKDAELHLDEIDRRMKSTLIGLIPYDNNIRASLFEGVPIVMKRDSYIAENFDKIALRLKSEK